MIAGPGKPEVGQTHGLANPRPGKPMAWQTMAGQQCLIKRDRKHYE